jgi:tellurite methyltransferase
MKSPSQTHWNTFYEVTQHRPPHATLLKALELFGDEENTKRFAVDLGCGSGRDTLELLRRGWQVLAVDHETQGIERLRQSVPESYLAHLQTRVSSFEELGDLPECDFINASYSLPFCHPTRFGGLWAVIERSIKPGGRFAGTFFGERDSWAQDDNMTFHTRAEVERLLESFDVEYLTEKDSDGKTALGEGKHWHVFEVVASKKAV